MAEFFLPELLQDIQARKAKNKLLMENYDIKILFSMMKN